MIKLENGLKEKIKIYIPSTYEADQKINNEVYVMEALKILSETFGGASSEIIQGAWLSESKGLIIEDIKGVYSYTDKLDDKKLNKVLKFVGKLKKELKQEAISLEINNALYFI